MAVELGLSVRYGLLALLSQAPKYGYQLKSEFEQSTGTTWPLNIGQVYSTLQRLERDGLVAESRSAALDDDHRSYQLTNNGRADLVQWFATPVARDGAPPRSELTIKLVLALLLPGVDFTAVVQTQRVATMEALQGLTQAKSHYHDDLAGTLVADSLIFAAQSEVQWLDHCEVMVARHHNRPAQGGPR
ncbi:MAG: PadR family transcriptional regulator [Actinomycetota bacterium]|nr:PadR family transcriptional regulator [Actinomycetota bacterium]MDQ6948869.1 PadR family transcriptional regulator [Actinomycetota bacterium]